EILSRTKDKMKFRLRGKKVEGVFVLVRFPKVRNGWIMVRS
ncbi:MAG: 3'-phosphoesterase, partial [Archaeoglobales archaeon]